MLLVFVAYLTSDMEPCHFPSIYFFNIVTQEIEWKIAGAETLIHITEGDQVYYLMNESWYEWSALDHHNHTDEERLKKQKSKINVV